MAWTYILRCSDDSYYVGSTRDLERRIGQHQEGTGAKYTSLRRPVELVWAAEFTSIQSAFDFEKQVQGWGRRKREALIEGRFDLLSTLASRSWSARSSSGDRPLPEVPPPTAPSAMPWDGDVEPANDPDDPWAPPVPRTCVLPPERPRPPGPPGPPAALPCRRIDPES